MTKILISAMNGIIGYELIKHLKKKYFVIAIDNEENGIAKKLQIVLLFPLRVILGNL